MIIVCKICGSDIQLSDVGLGRCSGHYTAKYYVHGNSKEDVICGVERFDYDEYKLVVWHTENYMSIIDKNERLITRCGIFTFDPKDRLSIIKKIKKVLLFL